MTDPITTSRSARESLSRGLNALQADPSVPPHLVELAAPIAQAMGALHQLEKSQALSPHADVALGHVRGALAQLQAQPPTHPAVANALEAVAASLSLVHSLSKMATAPAPQPMPAQPAPQPMAAQPAPQPMPAQPAPAPNAAVPVPTKTASMPQKPPQQAAQAAQPGAAPPAPAYAAPVAYPAAPPAFPQAPGMGPQVARDPFAPPPQAQRPLPPGPAPASPSIPVPAPPAGDLQIINADLGTHSPTNFYKGLAGNDIIDHGGLFVSTYVPPKIGTAVRLKISLPGGYEFEANAVVKWTREQGGDAPPGFGAQFTQITPEARQLVYRYVRNREPIFYDDL